MKGSKLIYHEKLLNIRQRIWDDYGKACALANELQPYVIDVDSKQLSEPLTQANTPLAELTEVLATLNKEASRIKQTQAQIQMQEEAIRKIQWNTVIAIALATLAMIILLSIMVWCTPLSRQKGAKVKRELNSKNR